MPTVTIRVSAEQRDLLMREAQAQGATVSDLVREALGLRAINVEGRLDDLERRVERIEQLARLD